jgi:hypothetical protein
MRHYERKPGPIGLLDIVEEEIVKKLESDYMFIYERYWGWAETITETIIVRSHGGRALVLVRDGELSLTLPGQTTRYGKLNDPDALGKLEFCLRGFLRRQYAPA